MMGSQHKSCLWVYFGYKFSLKVSKFVPDQMHYYHQQKQNYIMISVL